MRNSATIEVNTPRICLLTETFYPMVGGGETYARLFASRLSKLGASVFILTRRVDPKWKVSDVVEGVPVSRLPPSGTGRFRKYAMLPYTAIALAKMRSRYDIVYVANFRVLGLVAVIMARLLRKKCVLRSGTCGEMSGEYANAHRPRSSIAFKLMLPLMALRRRILKLADAFVSNNRAIREEFIKSGVPPRKIQVLANGVDTEVFRPAAPAEKIYLRAEFGLPMEAFIVGYSGKLNRGKGLDHLIAVWPKILAQKPESHLVLIGSGGGQSISCEEELREAVRTQGLESRVTFTGYTTEVSRYLQTLDVFVLPSEYEALSNALLEAMACGLPCIATNVGGLPDVIRHGANGLLIPPKSRDALVRAITSLQGEAAVRLASAARRTIEEKFSLDVTAKQHLDFLKNLARNRGRGKGAESIAWPKA